MRSFFKRLQQLYGKPKDTSSGPNGLHIEIDCTLLNTGGFSPKVRSFFKRVQQLYGKPKDTFSRPSGLYNDFDIPSGNIIAFERQTANKEANTLTEVQQERLRSELQSREYCSMTVVR